MFPVCIRLRIGPWLEIVCDQLDAICTGNETVRILERPDAVATVSLSFGKAWSQRSTDFQWLEDDVTSVWRLTIKERDSTVNRNRFNRTFTAPSNQNEDAYRSTEATNGSQLHLDSPPTKS